MATNNNLLFFVSFETFVEFIRVKVFGPELSSFKRNVNLSHE